MSIENETIRGLASVQQTKTGKLILRVSLHPDDMETLLLERGKQPDGLLEAIFFNSNRKLPEEIRFKWWSRARKNTEVQKRYVHLTSDQARELVEEMEKKDPEGAELLKLKLLTGVVEG